MSPSRCLRLFPGSAWRRGIAPGTEAFAYAPWPFIPFLAERGIKGPSFQIHLTDRVIRGGDRSPLSDGLASPRGEALPSTLVLLVYQGEAGFLQGVALSPGCSLYRKRLLPASCLFPVHGAAHRELRGNPRKIGYPISRMFLFQDFPQSPFSLVYEPPGSYFGGGFLRFSRRALQEAVPPASRAGFSFPTPIFRSTGWRGVP